MYPQRVKTLMMVRKLKEGQIKGKRNRKRKGSKMSGGEKVLVKFQATLGVKDRNKRAVTPLRLPVEPMNGPLASPRYSLTCITAAD